MTTIETRYAVYNPHNKPEEELPVIYGFNNGGSDGWYSAVVLAEDGTCLGSHVCSHEGWMRYDLGIYAGYREDRHENDYKVHFPDGYRMDFVPSGEVKTHEGLRKAYELNQQKRKDSEGPDAA